ncbi:hypothetical protein EUGRSUZ_D01359 [Eucalyptus grandis]|uniref:Uncharacterized protein n=2 Tax=Eucalyptus grandis TaxID=71139 RepID=A0ACC3L634_EUCGR|nr:hypothetical protein EUGRSUZ_D01359 [Eucalyptus grandis]
MRQIQGEGNGFESRGARRSRREHSSPTPPSAGKAQSQSHHHHLHLHRPSKKEEVTVCTGRTSIARKLQSNQISLADNERPHFPHSLYFPADNGRTVWSACADVSVSGQVGLGAPRCVRFAGRARD